jgi:protein-S-isoprenylcysteine O-methyltransferase Ste14
VNPGPGPGPRSRLLGWLAVAAQFAAIAAILLATGSSGGGPRWMWWLGLVALVSGALILLAAFLNLGAALTPNPVPNGASLRQDGMYRRVRHPIYTGVLLVMLGVVLRSPGWWPLVWWLVLLAILTGKAVWEERMLRQAFDDYPGYMRRTGRFLPKLRMG